MSGGFYMRLWWKQTNIWQNLKMLSCLLIYGSCSMWSKYVEYTVALRYSRMTGKQNVRALCQWTRSAMLSWRLNTRRRHQLSHRTTRVMREGSERNMNVWTKVHDNQPTVEIFHSGKTKPFFLYVDWQTVQYTSDISEMNQYWSVYTVSIQHALMVTVIDYK